MTTTNISHINYSFSTEGIHAALATRHLEFVQARLDKLFGIKTDAVKVTSKARLTEGAPFTLTCYSSRSESDTAAMAIAAKYVLPHLEDMKALTVQGLAAIDSWVPGVDLDLDLEAVGIIGDGIGEVSPAQRAWLEGTAVKQGHSVNVESLPNQNLAWLVFPQLMAAQHARDKAARLAQAIADEEARLVALAVEEAQVQAEADAKALVAAEEQARQDEAWAAKKRARQSSRANYDYQRIRVKLANDETTTVSMTCAVYMAMVRASRLSLPKLNALIRDVAKELSAMTQYVSLSQAVRVEVQNRLAGGAL